MSNRHGFTPADLPPGFRYVTVYGRMAMGWSFARAISAPVKKVPPKKTFAERMAKYNAKREAIRLRNEAADEKEKAKWNAKAEAEKVAAEKWRTKGATLPWDRPGYIKINAPGTRPI